MQSTTGSAPPLAGGWGRERPIEAAAVANPISTLRLSASARPGAIVRPLEAETHGTRTPRGGCFAEGEAPPRGVAPLGLVYSQTSQKPAPLDPVATRLSRLRRGVLTAARLHQEAVQTGGFRGRWAMLTATYRNVGDWSPLHLSALLDHVRKWLARRGHGMSYVWVAEMQKRGAIHYHALIWLPKGLTMPKPDKQGWWEHGYTRIEWARNSVGYMAKYASKGDGAKFPKGARLHGCGGLRGRQLLEARYWRRPAWLRERTGIDDAIVRRVGGSGWIDRETGEIHESPWQVFFHGGGVWIRRKDAGQYESV